MEEKIERCYLCNSLGRYSFYDNDWRCMNFSCGNELSFHTSENWNTYNIKQRKATENCDSKIIHPSYYNWIKNVECMDIVKHFDFPIGNVIKYCYRAGYKSTSTKLEDLQKARYYIDIAIEMEKNK